MVKSEASPEYVLKKPDFPSDLIGGIPEPEEIHVGYIWSLPFLDPNIPMDYLEELKKITPKGLTWEKAEVTANESVFAPVKYKCVWDKSTTT